jgi:hypothetical protein
MGCKLQDDQLLYVLWVSGPNNIRYFRMNIKTDLLIEEELHGVAYPSQAFIVSPRVNFPSHCADVCTASYDYGSPLTETRQLTTKYAELKRQGLFLQSSPDFYKTEWKGNSSSEAVSVSTNDVFAVHLQNPDTKTSFYIVRQTNSTSTYVHPPTVSL